MDEEQFRYLPLCSAPTCGQAAAFKLAAIWSDGTAQELKCYGLSCPSHRVFLLDQARARRAGLRLADGEAVGTVQLFELREGCRDAELCRLVDPSGRDSMQDFESSPRVEGAAYP